MIAPARWAQVAPPCRHDVGMSTVTIPSNVAFSVYVMSALYMAFPVSLMPVPFPVAAGQSESNIDMSTSIVAEVMVQLPMMAPPQAAPLLPLPLPPPPPQPTRIVTAPAHTIEATFVFMAQSIARVHAAHNIFLIGVADP